MANSTEGIILVQAAADQIVYANPTLETMFGYDRGEMPGKHVATLNAPTDKSPEETTATIINVLSEKGFWQGEIKSIRKDGTIFWKRATISSFEHHSYGKVWVSIQTDITEKRAAEAALKKSQEEWSATFDAMADIATIQDKDMHIARANKATGKGTGLGLALVHSIVEDCGGMITLDSEPGQGTTFHVFFPALIAKETPAVPAEQKPQLLTGTERILAVDDEETILILQKAILSRLGYAVTANPVAKRPLPYSKKTLQPLT